MDPSEKPEPTLARAIAGQPDPRDGSREHPIHLDGVEYRILAVPDRSGGVWRFHVQDPRGEIQRHDVTEPLSDSEVINAARCDPTSDLVGETLEALAFALERFGLVMSQDAKGNRALI